MSLEIDFAEAIEMGDLKAISQKLEELAPHEIAEEIFRLDTVESTVIWRLLPKDVALEVFEELDAENQQQILSGMREQAFRDLLERMDPDDRVRLLGEAPASFVKKVLAGLSPKERRMTAELLGYPEETVGRYMSPEVISIADTTTVPEILSTIRRKGKTAETISVIAVVDKSKKFVGLIELEQLVLAEEEQTAADVADQDAATVLVTDAAEDAARLLQDTNYLAVVVLDTEDRVVGVLTVDDAIDILEEAHSEDIARQAASLPSSGHYLSGKVFTLARLRIVWLLFLVVAATLTVSVLQLFENELERYTALALFMPMLIGTGGNVGAQAATSAVRAIALGEVRPQDVLRVAWRESRVGLLLGVGLGLVGLVAGWLVAGWQVGATVAIAITVVCMWAATVGAVMPLAAKALKIDPAVISSPMVTTLVDATGLLIYFLIAGVLLGL
ncbi:magnesium transporter [Aquiluna sp. KACHI24]|uniref:magnesium transporter n=1 Tax=Aquiluna sp. KACHI24 TaxID=2968831 RepID=UPI00220C012A|nr:magnesium transporter [Aquiluna sp. KACHI24]BDQ00704.1 magnesium transporter MgtE [Aquiluna sp. KACHI24]